MLFIIEMGMLIGGFYAVITGKIPSILVGGNNRVVEGWPARILGIIFIVPLPLAIAAGIVLGLLFGEDATMYASGLELILVFGAAIIGFIVVYSIGKKSNTEKTIDQIIDEKANNALFYSLIGLLGFGIATIFFSPLALYRIKQINEMIIEYQTGEQNRSKIKIASVLAVIALIFWGCNTIIWAGLIFGVGMQ